MLSLHIIGRLLFQTLCSRILSSVKSQDTKIQFAAARLEDSDAELVRACQRGEQAAWDVLVERYQRLIYAVPRRAGLSDEQAADVFQEVFLTLLQKLDGIEQPDKIRSWMVTTAKFKTWSVIRGGRDLFSPASEEAMEAEMAAIKDESPLADDVLIELEEQHLIRAAMERLEEKCRQILSMIYLRETAASYLDVAAAIGTGESSISPMRARCLKKLAKILSN